MKSSTDLVYEWFDRVWVKNDSDYIDEGLAEVCELTGLDANPITCRAEFHRFHQMLNELFSDFKITVDHLMENNGEFAGVVTVESIHRLTGKLVKVQSSFFGTIENGQICKVTNLVDYLGMLTQVDALPVDALPRGLSGQTVMAS